MDCAQALAVAAAALVAAYAIHPAHVPQRAEAFVEAALMRASFEHQRATPAMIAPQCIEAPKAIRL
jgi:hypothetical protein